MVETTQRDPLLELKVLVQNPDSKQYNRLTVGNMVLANLTILIAASGLMQ